MSDTMFNTAIIAGTGAGLPAHPHNLQPQQTGGSTSPSGSEDNMSVRTTEPEPTGTMVLSRPPPFEEIMAQQIQARPQVRVDDVPEWFANQYALMRERVGDMQRLAREISASGSQPSPE